MISIFIFCSTDGISYRLGFFRKILSFFGEKITWKLVCFEDSLSTSRFCFDIKSVKYRTEIWILKNDSAFFLEIRQALTSFICSYVPNILIQFGFFGLEKMDIFAFSALRSFPSPLGDLQLATLVYSDPGVFIVWP